MIRYAVASIFEHADDTVQRRFFTGALDVRRAAEGALVPQTSRDPAKAFAFGSDVAAEALAVALTELSGAAPPHDQRTWAVVELHDPIRRRAS